MLFQDKVALVTGASRGIGKAIALAFAREGAKVALNYAGNEEAAAKVKEEIEKIGAEGLLVKANVADEEEVNKMLETVMEKFGKVDILVNNAGIVKDGPFIRMKEENWDAVLDTNLKGIFHVTKAVTKSMMKQRFGRIINISSVVGIIGNIGQANYAAAKAGVIGFSKATAKELAGRNITINVVAPGCIETDMTSSLPDKVKEEMLKNIPLGRIGSPQDIAEAVIFLASEKANYITGQVLKVDGGMVM